MTRNLRLILFIIIAAIFIPWLGETLFNTKGEPREAIVAMSMLQSGDLVLPLSYGSDIPYKPPFLAWLIAIFSFIFNGGVVNEFTSRLPSAIATIAMIMAGFSWASKYASSRKSYQSDSYEGLPWIMAAVTATSFEVFRAAVNCRVDMVLTACIVIALYQMYIWRINHKSQAKSILRLAFIALLLSGATLSKGPVGSLLPCLAMGIYCLLCRDKFGKTLLWLSGVCIAAFILPAIWYVKAYGIGGEEFLALAMEENIGRLTGTMSYDSHINPWYYNIITITAGMLPWTLLVLFAICSWVAALFSDKTKTAKQKLKDTLSSIRFTQSSAFAFAVAATIFIFYCIPASKRSVYLLPMYPFMAFGVARLILRHINDKILRAYSIVIFAIALILPIGALMMQWLHPAKLVITNMPWWRYPMAILPIVVAIYWSRHREERIKYLTLTIFSLVFAYNSAFMPMFLNGKSDLKAVGIVAEAQKKNGPVFTYNDDRLMRYYTLNFYMKDTLRRINGDNTQIPADRRFCVLVSPDDYPAVKDMFPTLRCDTTTIHNRSCDTNRPILIATFRP